MRRKTQIYRDASSVSAVLMCCVWSVLALAGKVGARKFKPRQRRKKMTGTQTKDRAGSVMMFTLPETAQVAGWQTQAIEEYEHSLPAERAGLREEIAARIALLTGQQVSSEDTYADTNGHLAVAGVDGTSFRLYRGSGLVVARPCAYCGTGHFESPRISGVADLGYALGTWRPLHEDCEDYDASADLADWQARA